jgi:pyroglutamyl-peptidase
MSVALVTGSAPFAGLPDNPASDLLERIDGAEIGGVTIRTAQIPVSRARLPQVIDALVAEHRPLFYVSLGLATAAPVLRFETTAINRADFGVADNEGARPTDGGPIDPDGPEARFATWDAKGLAKALLAADIPAVVSHHAGTHLCNLVLYSAVGAMARAGLTGPVGFLHLPYTPKQVARFLRDGPPEGDLAPLDAPRAAVHAARDAGGGTAPDVDRTRPRYCVHEEVREHAVEPRAPAASCTVDQGVLVRPALASGAVVMAGIGDPASGGTAPAGPRGGTAGRGRLAIAEGLVGEEVAFGEPLASRAG